MKKGIHPKYNKEAKVILNGKEIMTVGSTVDELTVEIWSGNHPFYTGKEMLVDTDNLVDKYNQKVEASKSFTGKVRSKKLKRARRQRSSSGNQQATTLKDMLQSLS